MTHPNEELLVHGYYSGLAPELKLHLDSCSACTALFANICETLAAAAEAPLPHRGEDYGAQVWARMRPHLAPPKPALRRFPRWLFAPAMAALIAAVFVAGMLTGHRPSEPVLIHPPQFVTFAPPVPLPIKPLPIKRQIQNPAAPHRQAPAKATQIAHPEILPSEAGQDQKLLALNTRLSERDPAALRKLIEMIKGSATDKTKEHALFVLAQSDSPEARKTLLDFARESSDPSLQSKAIRMIGMVGGKGAHKELAGLYTSSSNQVLKREILNELMLSNSKSSLLTVAKTESDPGLRNSAIANLSMTGASSELSQLYRSAAPYDEKKQILNSVFLTGDANTLLAILKQEKDPALRVGAINSLAAISNHSAILTSVYRNDNDNEVRQAILDVFAARHDSNALWELSREETDLQKRAQILRKISTLTLTPIGGRRRP